MKRFLLCSAFWAVAFHWWVILRFVPPLRQSLGPLAFTQALYWINVPGRPLARIMGPRHFDVQEFGAMPVGPVEYGLIALFWLIVAGILAFLTALLLAKSGRSSNERDIQRAAGVDGGLAGG
ncbi:MAG TPA: hypothetical protein VN673_15095 [Clostridia bacterium]|nr:hypothetical protein [Clostridia bacterium]